MGPTAPQKKNWPPDKNLASGGRLRRYLFLYTGRTDPTDRPIRPIRPIRAEKGGSGGAKPPQQRSEESGGLGGRSPPSKGKIMYLFI